MNDTKKPTITINDREYKVDPGQTIMQAADKCGYHIPRLCYHPKLDRVRAACASSRSAEGMRNFRGLVLLPRGRWDEDPHQHQGTPPGSTRHRGTARGQSSRGLPHLRERDGNCELQRLVYSMGIRHRHFTGEPQAL